MEFSSNEIAPLSSLDIEYDLLFKFRCTLELFRMNIFSKSRSKDGNTKLDDFENFSRDL